jgi:alginate O-acetyltransferase complex protein AlgJ
VDYITGPGFLDHRKLAEQNEPHRPDPLEAILDLDAQLNERGIELIVMPTPVKPSIHPERFAPDFETLKEPLRSPSYPAFVEELERHGVLVFDAAPALLEAKRRSGSPQFLMTDTHWRPEAMELAATHLRDFIEGHIDLPSVQPPGYVSEIGRASNLGDVAVMLDLPKRQSRYPVEEVRLRQIRTADNSQWEPVRSADILLLGDSFSNIYSLEDMGWGGSAGLTEQLSFLLQRPIDRVVRNADGAFATRELLSRESARGNDRLQGKRLVIFQFAERELAVGNWKLIDLSSSKVTVGRFFVPDVGDEVLVSGTIKEIAPVPRPGTVPYADHITAAHLINLESERAAVGGKQAVVYLWGMRDHVLQEAARFRSGDKITVRLRSWTEVSDQYDRISRTELENIEVQLEAPTWGEVVNP